MSPRLRWVVLAAVLVALVTIGVIVKRNGDLDVDVGIEDATPAELRACDEWDAFIDDPQGASGAERADLLREIAAGAQGTRSEAELRERVSTVVISCEQARASVG